MTLEFIYKLLMIVGMAFLPISELRGAIILGIKGYHLHPFLVYVIAVIGNILPVFFILFFVQWIVKHDHHKKGILKWITERATSKLLGKYERLGELALLLFVAIPLPFSGAYTGAIASVLLGIPTRRAFYLISCGVCISGVIMTFLVLGFDFLIF